MKLTANSRQLQGSSASRRLRRAGRVPGIVYGGGKDAFSIDLDHNTLFHALRVEAFHSSVLDMEVGGAGEQVILRDVQWHPYKKQVLHIDFQRIMANEKMTMSVPLHFDGQDESPAIKMHAAIINHVITEVQVSCLPRDLPEYITVDMSAMDLDSSVHISDLKIPANVEVMITGDSDPIVATVTVKMAQEEPTDSAPASGEGDVAADGENKPADAS